MTNNRKLLDLGTVVQNKITQRKTVIKHDRPLNEDEEIIANYPHENDDFSYCCGMGHCRCMQ